MKKITFLYRTYEGEEAVRTVQDVEIHEDEIYLSGICELRKEVRTFKIDRIAAVIDSESGELRYEVREFLGLETKTPDTNQGDDVLTESALMTGRANEKYHLWHKKFFTKVISNHFKNAVFGSFYWKCFLCETSATYRDPQSIEFRHATVVHNLHFDHHIPRANGGLLIPGNIVVLCRECNSKKSDRAPEAVYTRDEWEDLRTLLTEQKELLRFQFNRRRWLSDKRKYYEEIGLSTDLIDEVLTNPAHRFFEGVYQESDGPKVTITA